MIPNAEIKEIFETTVVKWFDDSTKKCDRSTLFHAVWNGDSENLTKEMNVLLRRTISYHDYREDFYHAFLAGIFTGAGYMVDSNKEHGEGRSDVVVYDPINSRVAVFEAKYTKSLDKLESECDALPFAKRLMTGCMQKSMRMIMTKFSAMAFRFLRNVVW